MALVCDIKSSPTNEEIPPQSQEDLEDGEIEDDEEEPTNVEPSAPNIPETTQIVAQPVQQPPAAAKFIQSEPKINANDKYERDRNKDRVDRRRHDEKAGRKHMTEAEKSILHLRKREKIQREKWEKFRKDTNTESIDDDFAINIEKTLASILNKKEKQLSGDEEKEEDKRGSKRKKHDRDRQKNKQRKVESPKLEDLDESEFLNIRGASPENKQDERRDKSPTPRSEDSLDSEYSSDQGKPETRRKDGKKQKRNRDRGRERKHRDRDRRNEPQQLKDAQGVCIFYLQGKCQKTDCPYSHEAVPPIKLELCKFYLMDCCAKGENCSYMHSEFPCKFYHTGLQCNQGENCKFAHGKPLSDRLKQILFKHIETAPRDILGGFPRMSRDEALDLINETQKNLQEQYGITEVKDDTIFRGGIPSLFDINVPVPPELRSDDGKKGDKSRKPSRWQDPDPKDPQRKMNFAHKPFAFGQDLDMRINSNGDIDMRTLPLIPQPQPPMSNIVGSNSTETRTNDVDIEQYKREAGLVNTSQSQDVDRRIENALPYESKDVDIRQQHAPVDPIFMAGQDVDIRIPPAFFNDKINQGIKQEDSALDSENSSSLPADLPKTQRDLFMRIQAQQKENLPEDEQKAGFEINDANINWYSDDDDDDENRLTIKVDIDDFKEKEEPPEPMDTTTTIPSIANLMSPPTIKPLEVVEKLGDLSKIDISAEVTKLLTSMSQSPNQFSFLKDVIRDPRQQGTADPRPSSSTQQDPRKAPQEPKIPVADPRMQDPRLVTDPRKSRQSSTETQIKTEKISIYEQGSISKDEVKMEEDLDLRGGRSDVDLRSLQLPFKGMENYTPATEIDASIHSHLPMPWKVSTVEVPRPDYTGLKLSVSDAEKTGDPRLRKIFRLSVDEKDSPASPKASPKAGGAIRVDPRLRKQEESKSSDPSVMNYNQQLNMLQSSAFYQSLTSNQKVLLNQEIATRSDQSGSHDPILNSLLSNLNLIPGASLQSNPNLSTAVNILASVTKLNPMIANSAGNLLNPPVNPAILGQNTNLMNQMAQSMAQPGLLGAAPGIPNLPSDFPINFDPRNGGLLGNAPPFANFPPGEGGNFGNFNEEFYDQGNNYGHSGGNNMNRDNRGFNRDRRRGRNNFHRNHGNRNFRNRNNRSNRSHTPP